MFISWTYSILTNYMSICSRVSILQPAKFPFSHTDVVIISVLRGSVACDKCPFCESSYLSCCNKSHTCHTRDGYILTVTTSVANVTDKPPITRINVTFVAVARNILPRNHSSTGTVGVANEPTAVSSCMVSSSSSSNNNNNSRITTIFNDNLGKPGSATFGRQAIWASKIGRNGWDCWATNVSAGKYSS